MKQRLILLITVIAALVLITAGYPSQAAYKVHKVAGHVTVKRDGKAVALNKGMELVAKEIIEIGEGGSLEILNTGDSRIYSSSKPGSRSVSGFILSAKATADDNFGNVNSRISMNATKSKKSVYTEAGRVTRRLANAEDSAAICADTIIVEECSDSALVIIDTIAADSAVCPEACDSISCSCR